MKEYNQALELTRKLRDEVSAAREENIISSRLSELMDSLLKERKEFVETVKVYRTL